MLSCETFKFFLMRARNQVVEVGGDLSASREDSSLLSELSEPKTISEKMIFIFF